MSTVARIANSILIGKKYTITDDDIKIIENELTFNKNNWTNTKWYHIIREADNSNELIELSTFIKNNNYNDMNFMLTDEDDIVIDPIIKALKKRSKINNIQYTADQYDFLKSEDSLFCAPTSSGKSMIARSKIIDKIKSGKSCAMIVPLKSLITENSTEFLKCKNLECQIVTNVTQDIKPDTTKLYILTQERALALIEQGKFFAEYVFIDEFQNMINYSEARGISLAVLKKILEEKSTSVSYMGIGNDDVINSASKLNLNFNKKIVSNIFATAPIFFTATSYGFKYTSESKISEYNVGKLKINEHIKNILELLSFSENKHLKNRVMVYAESKSKIRSLAITFAEQMPVIKDCPELDDLINYVSEEIGEQYELIDMLKKGVAYHISFLDESTKIRIESLFKNGIIKVLFCTSTLSQGVNFHINYLYMIGTGKSIGKDFKIKTLNIVGRASRYNMNNIGMVILTPGSAEISALDKYFNGGNLIDIQTSQNTKEFAKNILNVPGLVAVVEKYGVYGIEKEKIDFQMEKINNDLKEKPNSISRKSKKALKKYRDYMLGLSKVSKFSFGDIINGTIDDTKMEYINKILDPIAESFKFTYENTKMIISLVNYAYDMNWSEDQEVFYTNTLSNYIKGKNVKSFIESQKAENLWVNSDYPGIYLSEYSKEVKNNLTNSKIVNNDEVCPKKLYSFKAVSKLENIGTDIEFELFFKIYSLFSKNNKISNDVKSVFETSLEWDIAKKWTKFGITNRSLIVLLNEICSLDESVVKIEKDRVFVLKGCIQELFKNSRAKTESAILLLDQFGILEE